jgi:hypothetical protein
MLNADTLPGSAFGERESTALTPIHLLSTWSQVRFLPGAQIFFAEVDVVGV